MGRTMVTSMVHRMPMSAAAAWHDAQQGGYVADLWVWRRLARGRVLELGAGTGRVALSLALDGNDVTALDLDAVLLRDLARRARRLGVTVATIAADAAELDLGERFDTIIAPASFLQIVSPAERARVLEGVAAHLAEGGTVAIELTEPLDELLELDLPGPPTCVRRGRQRYAVRLDDVVFAPGGMLLTWERVLCTGGRQHGRRRRAPAFTDVRLDDLSARYYDVLDPEAEFQAAGLELRERIPVAAPTYAPGVVYVAG